MSDSDDLGEELRDNLQLRRELKDEIAKATDSASQRVSRSFHGIGVFLAMFVLAVGLALIALGYSIGRATDGPRRPCRRPNHPRIGLPGDLCSCPSDRLGRWRLHGFLGMQQCSEPYCLL